MVNSDPCCVDALSASFMLHECKFRSNDSSGGRSCHWVCIYFCSVAKKIPQILCSQICYWPIYVHILIFDWLIFRDICICWIPIIHTSMCLFTEMFTLLVWSGGEAWKAECLCGDLWPELLQGFYFLTIKKNRAFEPPLPPSFVFFTQTAVTCLEKKL